MSEFETQQKYRRLSLNVNFCKTHSSLSLSYYPLTWSKINIFKKNVESLCFETCFFLYHHTYACSNFYMQRCKETNTFKRWHLTLQTANKGGNVRDPFSYAGSRETQSLRTAAQTQFLVHQFADTDGADWILPTGSWVDLSSSPACH